MLYCERPGFINVRHLYPSPSEMSSEVAENEINRRTETEECEIQTFPEGRPSRQASHAGTSYGQKYSVVLLNQKVVDRPRVYDGP